MKRLICLLISLTMALSLLGTSAYATTSSAEQNAVQEATEEYLAAKMREIYLHQSTYTEGTKTLLDIMHQPAAAAEDNDAMEEDSLLPAATQELLTTFAEDYAPELMSSLNRTDVSISDMIADLQCLEDMTAYKSYVYEDQGFAYSDFDSQYYFDDITIDEDYAVAVVYEELNYQYSDCDEPSYEFGEFNVVLAKLDGEWVIADVVSDDVAFMSYVGTGYNLDAQINAYDEAMKDAANMSVADDVNEESMDLLATGNDIAYNRQNAVNYALTYSTQADDGSLKPTFKNGRFAWFGADCMNYCSQAVWAGFGGSNSWSDIPAYRGMDQTGAAVWWCDNVNGSGSWKSCSAFRTYVSNAGADSKGLVCASKSISGSVNTLPYSASQLVGAVLHVEGYVDNVATAKAHAVFVNAATGNTRGTVMVCSYNRCRKNVKLSSVCAVGGSTKAIETIIPQTFKGGMPSLFVYGDLQNAIVSHTATRTLSGYSNTALSSFEMVLLRPDGSTAGTWNASNTTAITASFNNWNTAGEWSLKLTGKTSSGSSVTWYGTIRVV